MEKIYFVKKYHRGNYTVIKGSLKRLIHYFSYVLECGASWNRKINANPKTYKSFLSNLNKSYQETQGSCYDPDFVDEATEDDFINAEEKGYRTSIA